MYLYRQAPPCFLVDTDQASFDVIMACLGQSRLLAAAAPPAVLEAPVDILLQTEEAGIRVQKGT